MKKRAKVTSRRQAKTLVVDEAVRVVVQEQAYQLACCMADCGNFKMAGNSGLDTISDLILTNVAKGKKPSRKLKH